MITGFNTNIKVGNKVFHVQTEDGGRRNPRIETLVFVDGAIMASKSRSYADGEGLQVEEIRSLMVDQHKKMIQQVKEGALPDKLH